LPLPAAARGGRALRPRGQLARRAALSYRLSAVLLSCLPVVRMGIEEFVDRLSDRAGEGGEGGGEVRALGEGSQLAPSHRVAFLVVVRRIDVAEDVDHADRQVVPGVPARD